MHDKYIFTSESVTEGHPDKICDQIVDAILDEILAKDPEAKVACECLANMSLIFITGQITTTAKVDYEKIARGVLKDIGYDNPDLGIDYENAAIVTSISEQSADIAQGVYSAQDNEKTLGAGDQGMMLGYACDENKYYMPSAIVLAHNLSRGLSNLRKTKVLPYLRPDGKTQVSLEYEDGKLKRVDTILISTQHDPGLDYEQLKSDLTSELILKVIPHELIDEDTKFFINPTGRFVIGGPVADTGLSGRKIVVDTYGSFVPHGGGSFSGKDPSKVDRSAAYMARYIAKNLVAAGVAHEITIQLAYAIGRAEPVSILVDTNNSSDFSNQEIINLIEENFNLTPEGIVNELDLKRPIYRQVANYGHFGRLDLDLSWEKLDKVEALQQSIKDGDL